MPSRLRNKRAKLWKLNGDTPFPKELQIAYKKRHGGIKPAQDQREIKPAKLKEVNPIVELILFIIIYMKNLLDSDWQRTPQWKCK